MLRFTFKAGEVVEESDNYDRVRHCHHRVAIYWRNFEKVVTLSPDFVTIKCCDQSGFTFKAGEGVKESGRIRVAPVG